MSTDSRKQQVPLGVALMQKVQTGGPYECWPWLGHRNPQGYGRFCHNFEGRQKNYRVHRIIYELCYDRELTRNIYVRHLCHNPWCCNPAHLLEGTPQDNALDMWKAGRVNRPVRPMAPTRVRLEALKAYDLLPRAKDGRPMPGTVQPVLDRLGLSASVLQRWRTARKKAGSIRCSATL